MGRILNCIGERIMVIPYLSIRRYNHQHWKEGKTATGLSKETGWLILCFALDYAQARRIDFTEIALPQGKSMVGDGKMPKGYVWTYVRKGEAGRLPEGWSNVVEIDRKDEDITRKSCDSDGGV